ncbi:acyltransferase family protein [Alkalihalobacterium alkalinitrilicum]|uniref:acyltransferase family protein n=1 Tax=Alkalihalobacterium alkalinitrilicum TaxID=427920 RepID=UPI000995498F|nr:acyltransferase family protein [Alkalihalobacterium alkalinitrilicum]
MKQNQTINEVIIVRSIACLSIVFLHSIGFALSGNHIGAWTRGFFDSIHVLLYYGTPMFIFISELLIAYSYRNKALPKNFLRKRFKLIFLPFLCMALFYTIPHANTLENGVTKFLLNTIIGDFHGYFVLIIFQFYLIHMLFHEHLKRWNPKIVVTVALLINVSYLAIFNFTEPLNIPAGEYIWNRFYWVPFFGWVFYFILGYYCGYYFENFIKRLHEFKWLVLISPLISSFLLLMFYHSDFINIHSSKRIDLLLHTTVMCFFLFYIAQKVRKIPGFLLTVNEYSFGIYLLHMFFLSLVDFVYPNYLVFPIGYYILFLFVFSTISSIITIYYMNKWEHGKYIFGKVNKRTESNPLTTKNKEQINEKTYNF